jgi:hypothetical protein
MVTKLSTSGETPQSAPYPTYAQPQKRNAGTYANVGILCAIVALFIFPEAFGAAGIVLGAYAWRLDAGERRNRGLWAIIVSIVFMLLGIYYTSYYGLYNILP